ncbi:MAG: HAD-IIIC family phosphatase [Steroidobacteraceae bacterium]
MSTKLIALRDLPWLPRPSADFRERLAAIVSSQGDWGAPLCALATQFLGIGQAIALSGALERLRARGASPALSPFRLGVVGNSSLDFLGPLLTASALRQGIALEVIAADFGQTAQQAIDPASTINAATPDAVLLAVDHRGLPFRAAGRSSWPLFEADPAIREIDLLRQGFREHSGAVCLVQTLPPPPELLLGSLDAATPGTLRRAIAEFNSHVAHVATASGDALIDLEWLAAFVGLDAWFDDRQWYMARLPCAPSLQPLYADFVCRILGALRGRSRKCLILDLDNTLWGGVVGDDGLDGLALSPGDARGEAFRAIQQGAADLRRRGVVLAVCSKNDETTARQPFHSHPGMLLRDDDIAVFLANWDDKATNIERIAKRLELGLDAMVLLDDNPAERAQVRAALPAVAVPEPGDDPSSYFRMLTAAGYFESVAFTHEDVSRADQYRSNAEREHTRESARNLDDFLQSLETEIVCSPFDARGRKRIAQLINKTNQFNVTTRRYTEQQVEEMQTSPAHYTLQVFVRDKFGDNGMVSVVICRLQPAEWEIDTWLMSCRVLNRGIEQAVCNRLVRDALRAGARRLVGQFVPTERNGIVADLFERLTFAPLKDGDSVRWVLDLAAYRPFELLVIEAELHSAPAEDVSLEGSAAPQDAHARRHAG